MFVKPGHAHPLASPPDLLNEFEKRLHHRPSPVAQLAQVIAWLAKPHPFINGQLGKEFRAAFGKEKDAPIGQDVLVAVNSKYHHHTRKPTSRKTQQRQRSTTQLIVHQIIFWCHPFF